MPANGEGDPRDRVEMSDRHRWWAARGAIGLLVAWAAACKAERGPSPADASAPASEGASIREAAHSGNSNVVEGSVRGNHFPASLTSFAVPSDAADARTVVYVFSGDVTCMDLSFSDWDERLPEGTEVLSVKAFDAETGPSVVVSANTLSVGKASASFIRASRTKTPEWISATGGLVSLETIGASPADRSLPGSFTLWFGTDRIAGAFIATRCPAGHEP